MSDLKLKSIELRIVTTMLMMLEEIKSNYFDIYPSEVGTDRFLQIEAMLMQLTKELTTPTQNNTDKDR